MRDKFFVTNDGYYSSDMIFTYLGIIDRCIAGFDEKGIVSHFLPEYVKFLRDDEVVAKKLLR